MKRIAIAAALLAPLALLCACTTATPYQPLATGTEVSGGYTDQRLDDSHFRISFSGNTATSREQVEDYLLYRAAELTTGKGFDWFEMVDRHTENTGETYVTPDFYGYGPGWGYWRPSWRFRRHGGWGYGPWGGPWGWDDYEVERFDRYTATADIVVGHGARPASDKRAFDAHEVMQNLGPKIVRPGEKAPAH
jgi:hypothetical protein